MPEVLTAVNCPKCGLRQYQRNDEKFKCIAGCKPARKRSPRKKTEDKPSEPIVES